MSALTIANIDPETEAGLRRLAARNGRTLEAEIADLLAKAAASAAPSAHAPGAKGLGSEIAARFGRHGGFGTQMREIIERHGAYDLPDPEPLTMREPLDFSGPDFDR